MFRRDKWWHREIERMRRDHAAREAELIATICHLHGRPLPTPPAAFDPTLAPDPEPKPRYVAAPEQYPLDS